MLKCYLLVLSATDLLLSLLDPGGVRLTTVTTTSCPLVPTIMLSTVLCNPVHTMHFENTLTRQLQSPVIIHEIWLGQELRLFNMSNQALYCPKLSLGPSIFKA